MHFILYDKDPTMIQRNSQNWMTLMNKHLATVGKKTPFEQERNSWNQAQGGAAICHDRSGVRGGRRDKRCSVEESPRLLITSSTIMGRAQQPRPVAA